jgi:hypothetical protein
MATIDVGNVRGAVASGLHRGGEPVIFSVNEVPSAYHAMDDANVGSKLCFRRDLARSIESDSAPSPFVKSR